MNVGRRLGLLAVLALGLSGCRAGTTGSFWTRSRPAPPASTLDLGQFIDQHNHNASLVQSLKAKPSIKVGVGRGYLRQYHLDGRMALERPKNFRLELSSVSKSMADLGSNDREFWFWLSREINDDPAIYWCAHDDADTSPVAAAYQPDWIMEAMGLVPISSEDAKRLQTRAGPEPGTTTLVFPAARGRPGSYTRALVVSDRDRRIKQLQIYDASSPRVLIARAVPLNYTEHELRPGETGPTRETCLLPEELVLEWKQERPMKLDVVLLEVELNELDPSARTVLFNEPEIEGYPRRNLAALDGGPGRRGAAATRTRSTMPSPTGPIRLGRPAPISEEDEAVTPAEGEDPGPGPSGGLGDASPGASAAPVEDLVGAALPSPPDSPAARAARRTEGYPSSGFTIER